MSRDGDTRMNIGACAPLSRNTQNNKHTKVATREFYISPVTQFSTSRSQEVPLSHTVRTLLAHAGPWRPHDNTLQATHCNLHPAPYTTHDTHDTRHTTHDAHKQIPSPTAQHLNLRPHATLSASLTMRMEAGRENVRDLCAPIFQLRCTVLHSQWCPHEVRSSRKVVTIEMEPHGMRRTLLGTNLLWSGKEAFRVHRCKNISRQACCR